jgi:putative membrane protein
VSSGARQLSNGIIQATDPLVTALGDVTAAQNAAATTMSSVIDQLSASPDPLANNAAATLRGVRDQLRAHEFSPTAQQLTDKLTQLRSGVRQLASGSAQLASGIVQLDNGAQQLKTGTAQLRSGSSELATKLGDGAKQVPNWTTRQQDAIADTIGGPVNLQTTHENAAPNFGTGMAPFFLTLALFFGALVLWMVLRPLQNRAIAAEVLALRVVLASYLPAVAIGVIQAGILYCVVRFALGMQAAHPVAMFGFMVLISCSFVAATQAINALVGPAVGRVLIMALLMLQLVSAGGMYPVQTTSRPFQILHTYDPMAYGVNGLRQLILGGIDYRLWQAIIVLGSVWAVALLISSLSARRNRLWNLDRLLPAIKV